MYKINLRILLVADYSNLALITFFLERNTLLIILTVVVHALTFIFLGHVHIYYIDIIMNYSYII